MKKKWVIINIETKSREFEAKVMLSRKLVERGYGVILTNFRHIEDINGLPKGIFLDRNIFRVREKVINELKSRGFKIICLDEEGLVYLSKEKYLSDRVPKETFEMVDKFLCWGEEQFSIIKSEYPYFAEKLAIVGNPRIDLLKEEYSTMFRKEVDELTSKYKPYILIVSNFTSVNMLRTPHADEEKYLYHLNRAKKLGFIKNEVSEKEFNDRYIYIDRMLKYFLQITTELSESFPNFNIIIRPHPSEDHGIWEKVSREKNNIKVIYKNTLNNWIKGAELVINNSCTSSIESLVIGKSCISYRPMTSLEYDQSLPNKVSRNAFTENEVIKLVKDLDKGNVITEDEKEIYFEELKKYILMDSNKDSVEYIADEIDKISIDTESFSKLAYRLSNLNLKKKIHIFLSKRVFYGCKIINKIISEEKKKELYEFYKHYKWNKAYEDHKIETISKYEISNLISELDKIKRTDNKIKIHELKGNTFIITSN